MREKYCSLVGLIDLAPMVILDWRSQVEFTWK